MSSDPRPPSPSSVDNVQNLERHELNTRLSKLASLVWSLRIRITKTAGSSIPAIAALDTWGYVAYSCPAPLAREVLLKWHSLNRHSRTAVGEVDEGHKRPSPSSSLSQAVAGKEENLFQIPDEFLDGLTCEIMALPVRLPSGNVIDERTLERFTRQEASWGRGQSDPFTGRPFTSTHRPLYDVALKARIDAFLLVETHRQPVLRDVPRTTGPIRSERSSDELLVTPASSTVPVVSRSAAPTRAMHEAPVDPSRRLLSHLARNLQHVTGSSRSSSSRAVSRAPAKVSASSVTCSFCNKSGATNLYALPCSHLVCRPCLLTCKERNDLLCSCCQQSFGLHEPVLHHTV